MPRPRKPTALLELNGAFKKNPARAAARFDEPRPTTGIGDPPADFLRTESTLAARHLRIWHELIAQAPEGVLTGCDRMILANTCRIQAAIEGGKTDPGMFNQLRGHLNDMGMTPVGRSKVAGTKKKPDSQNPWEAMRAETRPRAN